MRRTVAAHLHMNTWRFLQWFSTSYLNEPLGLQLDIRLGLGLGLELGSGLHGGRYSASSLL